nr:type VI secretion system baseplate subunit TssG [Massilia sp. Se16.2.3]
MLGSRAIAGERVWQRDLRLRLVVGPLDYAGFIGFLPGGQAARALASLLVLLVGVTLEIEVELVLRAADVRPVTMREGSTLGRLGWDTYLVAGQESQDRQDVRYAIAME